MKSNLMSDATLTDDGRLVGLVLAGNREAFGQLVARYQATVCGLAYSACGNVSQSEDLAQEIFLVAWRKLKDLQEPAKFRSWLFGIARNLINNTFRQQARNPLAAAESLDENASIPTPVLNPTEQAINKEEEAILWRSLEQIPETYRDPMVLFYRENQSIEQVAAALEVSEEAARQRLSRGRKLLQEQVLVFVEGALRQTGPGPAFTVAVLAALPMMTFSAKAATFGAVAKGGAVVKSAGLLGMVAGFLAPVISFAGMWMDYRLRKAGQPEEELRALKKYYLGVSLSVVLFFIAISLLMANTESLLKSHTALFVCLSIAIVLGYPLALGLFAWNLFRNARKEHALKTGAEAIPAPINPAWEYRSKWELLGLPLIHIRFGGWFGRSHNPILFKPKFVTAWFAASDGFAIGIIGAYGGMALAPISIGACAVGLLSYGAVAAGVIAVGGFGMGLFAGGAAAFGWKACGDGVIAWHFADGGKYAIAHDYALGNIARAAEANTDFVRDMVLSDPFFSFCWQYIRPLGMSVFWLWVIPLVIFSIKDWRAMLRGKSLKNHLKTK